MRYKTNLILLLIIGIILSNLGVTTVFASEPQSPEETEVQQESSLEQEEVVVKSPDQQVKVNFSIAESQPQYKITYQGTSLLDYSELGFEFENQPALDGDFKLIDISRQEFNNTWQPVWGEDAEVKNHYHELTLSLQEKNEPYRKLDVVFRVYNDGVGFRYVLPEQPKLKQFKIMNEQTEFNLSSNNQSWWIPNDWNSYEYNYLETKLSDMPTVSTPLTMKTPQGIHLSIHEAALVDYAGMALKLTEDTTLQSHLAPWPDDSKVKGAVPLETPWRTIQIGDNAGDLVESNLIMNLNEPNKIENTDWIEPVKYIGIWWEMHIDKSSWESGSNHGATTDNAKRYIDFANEYLKTAEQNIALLVEGWNRGWDGNWMENGDKFDFTKPYPDFTLEEVVDYAEKHDVEYMMHNETAGDIKNYESQMGEAYDYYQSLGINAIKSGYVADHGLHNPAEHNHHGQYMVNHYLEAVKKAAEHEIMINTHEPIKGTGLYRTYPNWISREGVKGMEYNAWSGGNPPAHTTILPFTRMLSGPIDYTPGIFDVEIKNKPSNRVHTTRAKQLALYVTITSGSQMIADLPQNYKDDEGNILPEFEFIKQVPVTWEQTLVPQAEIGDYATIVRRKGQEWYLGSITDEKKRNLEQNLDFLAEDEKYVAQIYKDAPGTNWQENPTEVEIKEFIVDTKDTLEISLAAGGGQAVRFYPASEEEIETITEY